MSWSSVFHVLCILGLSLQLHAQQAGASSDRVLERTFVRAGMGQRLDDYLERASKFGFSGTILVADAEGVVLHKGYGWSDVKRGKKNTVKTIFDMGSMAKALTAAAILRLEEEGKLSVSDPISKYFDAPADKKDITLHQLMTHTSGLLSDVGGDYDDIPKEEAIRRAFAAPLVSEPGKAFNYSNIGFSLLAVVMEKLTGEGYESYLRRKFLLPHGMKSTGYRLVKWKAGEVAHNYTQRTDLGSPLERLVKSNGPNWNLMGNGGILTTTADVYRWELGLRSHSFLSEKQQAKQFSPRFRRTPRLANGYDWWIEDSEWDTATAYHRGGDSPAYALNAEFRRYPAEKVTIILLANNRLNGWSSRRYIVPAIRKIMLGKEQPIPPSVRPAKVLPLEANENPELRFRIEPVSGHLRLLATGQAAVDALTFFRSPVSLASRRRLNARAEEFIAALQRGDRDKVAPFVVDQVDAVLSAWQKEVGLRKGLAKVEVLGTSRLDRGQFLTTLRLRFGDRSSVAVRFCWASNRIEPSSDDTTFPAFTPAMRVAPLDAGHEVPFWSTGIPGEFVAHDLLTTQTLRLTLEAEFMVIHVPEAPLRVRIHRK